MSRLRFLCGACQAERTTTCGDAHVYLTTCWWVDCWCDVCGTTTAMQADQDMAKAILYWQKVDDANAYAQLRCRAYAGDLSEDDLAELGAVTVWEAEEFLRGVGNA